MEDNGAPCGTGSRPTGRASKAVSPVPASIPSAHWYWCGYPGHFIGGSDCCFHLHTRIGHVIVSTVGDYRPRAASAAFSKRISIGCDRDFETYVFLALDTERPEGTPLNFGEIDSLGSNDSEESERQHYEMCARWATAEKQTEAASAIEARRAETQGGSVADESAVGNAETPTPPHNKPRHSHDR